MAKSVHKSVPKPKRETPAAAMNVEAAIAWLKKNATKKNLEGMARYAIPSEHAFGVAMRDIQTLAKQIGKNHELALQLWATGWYEARLLAVYVDDPERLTVKQLDAWTRDFDNWAVCDTACFGLFKRSEHAWGRLEPWAKSGEEFVRRTAFALLWSLAGRGDERDEQRFFKGLQLIEKYANDERNFVKKAVNMALRAVGKVNGKLNEAAQALAKRLAASDHPAAKWIGKDALRELSSAPVQKRLKSE